MNILMMITNLEYANGGVCTHVLDLCKELTRDKENSVILVADGTDFLRQIEEIDRVEYVELPLKRVMNNIKSFAYCIKRISQICNEKQIQIIHLHSQRSIPIAWIIKITKKIPFVWTNHIDSIPQKSILSLFWKIMRFLIISVSDECKHQLVDELGVNEDYITVISNGVRLEDFSPVSFKERKELCMEFDVSESEFVISEVARICSIKCQEKLIQSVSIAQKKYGIRNIKVLIAGCGDEEWISKEVVERAEKERVQCELVGFQNPRTIFGISHLAVECSLFEGFSLASAEALAMNCPVIRTNTPGWSIMKDCAYVLDKDSKTFIDDLAAIIAEIYFDYEKALSLAGRGRRKCEQEFNVVNMAEKTLSVYKEVVKNEDTIY